MAEQGAKKSDLTCLLWVLGSFAFLACAGLGTLFAVAYQNSLTFNCRAMQSEAKSNLMGLFTAEKSFFAEYDAFSSDLNAINWYPDGTPRYVVGFVAASHDKDAELSKSIAGYDPNRMATDHPAVIGTPPRYDVKRMVGLTRVLLPPDAIVHETAFVGGAVGNIDGDATLDVWTIDDQRQLVNVVNDCVQ